MMMRVLFCAAVAVAALTGPVAADRGSHAVAEWLQQCDSPRADDRRVCVALLHHILAEERQARNGGDRSGYVCPPADYETIPVLRLVNQQVRARSFHYAQHLADSTAPNEARMIGLALDALTDVFPCPGKG